MTGHEVKWRLRHSRIVVWLMYVAGLGHVMTFWAALLLLLPMLAITAAFWLTLYAVNAVWLTVVYLVLLVVSLVQHFISLESWLLEEMAMYKCSALEAITLRLFDQAMDASMLPDYPSGHAPGIYWGPTADDDL